MQLETFFEGKTFKGDTNLKYVFDKKFNCTYLQKYINHKSWICLLIALVHGNNIDALF